MAAAAPAVYAIAWNNHFLCARFESPSQGGRVYLIDSLGRTLHSLCSSAFILRFGETPPSAVDNPTKGVRGGLVGGHARNGSHGSRDHMPPSTASSTSSLCEDGHSNNIAQRMPAWRECALFFRNVYAGGVVTRVNTHLAHLSPQYVLGGCAVLWYIMCAVLWYIMCAVLWVPVHCSVCGTCCCTCTMCTAPLLLVLLHTHYYYPTHHALLS